MTHLLEKAGGSFLRAFAVSFVVFATGILAAPNTSAAWSLSIAAFAASIAAGLRAVQVLVPSISTFPWFGSNAKYVDSFVRAFLAAFIVGISGWLSSPDLSGWKSIVLGVTVGALTAGVRALQALLTLGEDPVPGKGI